MKFKTEINYSKEGWIILTFPSFKLHVNKTKNESILYSIDDEIDKVRKKELNILFEGRLFFIKDLIEKLGINYFSLARKDRKTSFIFRSEIKPFIYTAIAFRFFGYISEPNFESEFSWVESFEDLDFTIKLSKDKLDVEKMILQIGFKELIKNN